MADKKNCGFAMGQVKVPISARAACCGKIFTDMDRNKLNEYL